MRIKDISIRHFRGFEHQTFELDPQMNVVLGDNTSGKTTLLHGVQVALGAYLQALTLLPGGKPYRRSFKDSDWVRKYSEANRSFLRIQEKPEIAVTADFFVHTFQLPQSKVKISRSHGVSAELDGQAGLHPLQSEIKQIHWAKSSNNLSQKHAKELLNAVAEMQQQRMEADETGQNVVFPLLLSFGANRLEKNYRAATKTKARESNVEKAYKCALEEEVDFQSAFDWIYKYDRNLDKGQEFEETDQAFLNAIRTAIPAILAVDIDRKNNEFSAQIKTMAYPTPKWLTYSMMSDGFKAMINIVAEIAYRCIQLNGFLGAQAVTETPGVVLIDELDLYLHPHWQQHVLADLRKAFPWMQFIITTHSPFIVQSVASHNIITLDGKKGYSDPNKRSIEEIVVSEMNMDTVRSAKYNEMLEVAENYYQLVKSGKGNTEESAEVKEKLDGLELQFSDDPAYVALLRAERGDL